MEQAAKDNKYLFGFFWKTENEQTISMKKVFEDAIAKVSERATAAIVQVTDPAEREIVKKFGLDRAPMPLALAIAPNGAIMGGFPNEVTEEALVNAFGSPSTEKCMKSLQDGKLVFLCVQNAATTLNAEALQGVQDFKAESQYTGVTEIVKLDPADSAEASFLGDLKIDPQTKVAVTAFLAPPGAVIAEFEGATKKERIDRHAHQGQFGLWPRRFLRTGWLWPAVTWILHEVGRIHSVRAFRTDWQSVLRTIIRGRRCFDMSNGVSLGLTDEPQKTLVMEGR